jgi:diaminopimelate decarboxylase
MTLSKLLPANAELTPDDVLIGGVSLGALAQQVGTPAYVIDEGALRERASRYRLAFTEGHANSLVCFATKAYPSISVLRVMASEGLGCDVVGAGELRMALLAGVEPARIVMHGNAKSDEDIAEAITAGIGYLAVDSFDDIGRVARIAPVLRPGYAVPVLLRVAPGIDSSTHAAMATGAETSKFGFPLASMPAAIERCEREPAIELQGLHAHIGSQISELSQFEDEVVALARLPRFGVYDFGGGLGVPYLAADPQPQIEEYAQRLIAAAHRHLGPDVRIIVEPGRSVVAPTGVTLYRVLTVKHGPRTHVAVDGGMGDNLEPSLYGQRFSPIIVNRREGREVLADLVGRHCESGDVITPDVSLLEPVVGDLVVVPVTGAYCFTMANNYNGALRPPVVFCRDGEARIVVRRETFADLIGREVDRPLPVAGPRNAAVSERA